MPMWRLVSRMGFGGWREGAGSRRRRSEARRWAVVQRSRHSPQSPMVTLTPATSSNNSSNHSSNYSSNYSSK